jgi:hypothetical protein
MMLLEDAEDLCDFLLSTKRTVRPSGWVAKAIAAAQADQVEGLF